jgi:acetyltransferase-like isoleucine patch superfamily enzyme
MLGAKIEPGARISVDCDLAEYDLVTVGRDAAVELSTLRGFGVDQGAMILGPVKVGMSAGVGIRSVVAPYTSVQEGEDLGPGTSTYDALALNPKHARVNRQRFPQPSLLTQLFVGVPIVFLVNCAGQIPPMIVVYSLLWYKSREHTDNFFSNWNDLMDWLCDPQRIPFFFGIRLARALLSPFCYMAFAVMVKWLIIGKIQPGRRHVNSEWQKLQLWLLSALFARKKVQAVTDLMGRHYENVSRLYRILGAKVGKRVFWPGNQPVCNGLFDLLEIGDDAVFGSRSTLLCASVDRLDKIVLCAGANVSDNCVVLPGTVVGRNAVLGSNSISREGAYLPSGSVWFGNTGGESACLESGDGNDASYYQPLAEENGDAKQFIASETLDRSKLPMEGDETTLRPFGKAVYLGQAKGYWVLPVPFIIVFSWLNRAFCSIFHTLPLLMAIQLGGVLLYSDDILQSTYSYVKGNYDNNSSGSTKDNFLWFSRDFHNDGDQYHYPAVFWAVLQCFLFTHLLRVVCWLFLELCSKWLLMGRRKPGRYNYDTSSYAQRWEIYQLAAKIRKISRLNLLQFISGTPFMNWYIRLNGGYVGKDCCLFPTGADPFPPEPDLLTIKDGCVIDKASLVCHLNTRGNFQLAPIVLEPKSTLRAHSRVQQGIHMEEGAQLLEKSIAMTGEVIDSRAVWQGSPATLWFRLPESDLEYAPPKHLQNEGIELTPVKK